MKLGNVSHSLINIPSFFYAKEKKNLQTFYFPRIKKYFKCSDLTNLKEELNFNHNKRNEISSSKEEKKNSLNLFIKKELSNKHLKQVKRNEQLLHNYEKFKRNYSYSNLSSEPFRKYIQNKCKTLLEMINNDTKENLINRELIDNNCNISVKNWNNKIDKENLFNNTLKKKIFCLFPLSPRNKELLNNKNYFLEDKKSFKEKIKIPKYFIKSKLLQNKILNNNNKNQCESQSQNLKLTKL